MDTGFGAIKYNVTVFLGIDRQAAEVSKTADAKSTTPNNSRLDSLGGHSIFFFL